MKKLCSVICAASVALSLAVPAFATEQTSILGSTPGEVAVVEELLKNPEATATPAPSEATPGEVETSEEDSNTAEITESVEINETNFPDPIFRQYIADNFDTDKDGVLSKEEIARVTTIRVNGNYSELKSLKGIEFFTELTMLDCGNTQISELDVSKNVLLESLNCYNSQISELDVSKNVNLQSLSCGDTQISKLDLSKNVLLESLDCYNSQISELDVTKNVNLQILYCSNTQISELDVSKNVNLQSLSCHSTQISELNLSNNKELRSLTCYGTLLNQLDLTQQKSISDVAQSVFAVKLEGEIKPSGMPFVRIDYSTYSYNPETGKGEWFDHSKTYDVYTDTFSIKEKAPMFDATKVQNIKVSNGAIWNPETGAIENIKNGKTEVSYQYVASGVIVGASETTPVLASIKFTLEKKEAPAPTATPAPTAQPTATPAPTAQPSATPAPTSAPVPTATPAPTAQPTATPVPTGAPVPTATPVPGTPGEITGDKADQLLKDPNNTQLANEIVTQINYERYMNVTSKVATAVANAIRYNPMNLGASKDGIQFGATLHKDNSGFVLVPESAAIEGNRAQVSLHFEDGKGNVVQPKLGGLVTVKIAGKTMPAGDYVLVGEGNRMIDSVTVTTVGNDTVISFWAPHFSTYAIVPRSAYVAPSDNNNGGGTVGNPIKATGLDMSMALMGVVAMAGVAVVGGAAVAKKAKKD